MLGLTFFSKLDWGSYIISIVKTASKKIGTSIRSMKFLSPEVALYLCKSTIRPCMEYCCQVWSGTPNCYLELLDKLQIRICRTVGSSLAASIESSLKYGQLRSFLQVLLWQIFFKTGLTGSTSFFSREVYLLLIDCMIFLSPFPDVKRIAMSRVSFLASQTLEFSTYRMLSFDYDLNGFKSRINRHLLTVGSF